MCNYRTWFSTLQNRSNIVTIPNIWQHWRVRLKLSRATAREAGGNARFFRQSYLLSKRKFSEVVWGEGSILSPLAFYLPSKYFVPATFLIRFFLNLNFNHMFILYSFIYLLLSSLLLFVVSSLIN